MPIRPLRVAVALLCLGACSSTSSHERTAELGSQFTSVAADLESLQAQVDTALQGLEALSSNAGLAGAYDSICTAAANIAPAAARIRSEIGTSQATGKAHFASWSAQNVTIQDAELRGRANARQQELADLLEATGSKIGAALDLCDGFQQSLADLQKYLASDLSATAIGNAADLIARMHGDGKRLSTALESARQDAGHLGGKMNG